MNLAALSTQHQRQSGFLARRQFGNWIDGRAAEPRSGCYLPVVDPATEMTIAEVAASDARDVDAAVAAARRAFDSGDWPRMRPASRESCCISSPSASSATRTSSPRSRRSKPAS